MIVRLGIINRLLKSLNQNSYIFDMGCGKNWIKELPAAKNHHVTGIDPSKSSREFCDVIGEIGDEWCVKNKGRFDLGFSLNSAHFGSHDQISDNIKSVTNLLNTEGLCYFTFNQARIEEYYSHPKKDGDELYVKSKFDGWVKHFKENYILVYSQFTFKEGWDAWCGHMHFVVKKRK